VARGSGVDVHDRINAQWADLIVPSKRSFPPERCSGSEKTKQMFFLASYNIDKFRTFVFESSFLKRYPADPQTLDKIKIDGALLEFGLTWLKGCSSRKAAQFPQPPKQD